MRSRRFASWCDTPFRSIEGGAKTLAHVIRDVRTRGLTVAPKGQNEPIPAWAEDHWAFTTRRW